MKRVTEQLTKYYQTQGLTGDDLSAAVAADVGRVRDNADGLDPDDLNALFYWAASAEGHDYWAERDV